MASSEIASSKQLSITGYVFAALGTVAMILAIWQWVQMYKTEFAQQRSKHQVYAFSLTSVGILFFVIALFTWGSSGTKLLLALQLLSLSTL